MILATRRIARNNRESLEASMGQTREFINRNAGTRLIAGGDGYFYPMSRNLRRPLSTARL